MTTDCPSCGLPTRPSPVHGGRACPDGCGPQPMGQSQARQLARQLNQSRGGVYIAATVPLGSWGGTEAGWSVFGPEGEVRGEPERVISDVTSV
jgi:hypothetical protein